MTDWAQLARGGNNNHSNKLFTRSRLAFWSSVAGATRKQARPMLRTGIHWGYVRM